MGDVEGPAQSHTCLRDHQTNVHRVTDVLKPTQQEIINWISQFPDLLSRHEDFRVQLYYEDIGPY